MKKDQFKRIIKLLQPQKMTDIRFGKVYYRAYLYVIRFYWQGREFVLRMYIPENTAEILEIHSSLNIHGNVIEDWEHIISDDEVPYEIRKQIEQIQQESEK